MSTASSASGTFDELVPPYRRELLAHGYQMLGSVHDAEDAVQETMVRAWNAWDRYDPELASVRTWLHAIVTNTCLTALASRKRRMLPSGLGAPATDVEQALVPTTEVPWVQPIPSAMLEGDAGDPATALVRNGRVRLAFIVALQHLSPRQRSVLILREVLRFSAAEVADMLGTSTVAVNSSLQRARAALPAGAHGDGDGHAPVERDGDAELLDRYTDAFVRADVGALRALLVDEAVMEMPPVPLWYRGRDAFVGFMSRAYRLRGTDWKVVPVGANGQVAFGAYVRDDGDRYVPHSIQVLDTEGGAVSRNVVFFDQSLFALFGLPEVIAEVETGPFEEDAEA